MAKKAYVGVNSVARKVKKLYVGVGGVARKVKKAYIGVAGVARLFYQSTLELVKLSGVTSITTAADRVGAAANNNYGFFAGGNTGYARLSNVNAYNKSLTKSNASALSQALVPECGVSSPNYAVFADDSSAKSDTNAYNTSMTKVSIASLTYARYDIGGVYFNGNILFVGGYNSGDKKYVDAYSGTDLAHSNPFTLSTAASSLSCAIAGNMVIFAGGSYSTSAYAYDTSYTKSSTTLTLSETIYGERKGITFGNYAVFALRSSAGKVDAFNGSLTKTQLTNIAPWYDGAASVLSLNNHYAVFRSGVNVRQLNTSFTASALPSLGNYSNVAALAFDKYALFGGGADISSNVKVAAVEGYKLD